MRNSVILKTKYPNRFLLTTDRQYLQKADAVVFHLPEINFGVRINKRPGQLWVAWYLECEVHYPHITDPSLMSCFDLTMSYCLDADIVSPYLHRDFGELLRKPAAVKQTGDLASMFVLSHYNQSGRIEYLKELMHFLDVHSYGKLFGNKREANDNGRDFKMKTLAHYQFNLAFENAVAPDYVTEKFFDPLIAGTVPVYLGAPNIDEFAPGENCFINAAEFDDPRCLAEYLLAVAKDEQLYRRFFD